MMIKWNSKWDETSWEGKAMERNKLCWLLIRIKNLLKLHIIIINKTKYSIEWTHESISINIEDLGIIIQHSKSQNI